MDIGKAIYKILSGNVAVASMVGTRISPNVMHQSAAFPFIVYDVSTDTPEGQKDSVALLDTASIMVSGYCKNYNDASKLANYIRTALDRVNGLYVGVNIQAINFDGYDDVFDDMSGSDGVYRKSLNFNVRILNSFNNIYSTAFDGVDDSIALGVVGMDAMSSTGSISAWFKLETITSSGQIFQARVDADNSVFVYYHASNNELTSSYLAGGVANTVSTSEEVEDDGLWHHVGVTWDSSARIALYLDGTSKDSRTISDAIIGSFSIAAIGNNTEESGFWKGNIDEVSIYNYKLSAANITTLYNEGLPYTVAADTGLIGWWRMGDGTLTGNPIATVPTIPDETGNNNGTMNNMTSEDFEADVPNG